VRSGSREECRLSTNFTLLLDERPKFGHHHFCIGYFQFNAYNPIWFSVGGKMSKTVSHVIVLQSYQCMKSQRSPSSGLYTAAALYDILPISFLRSVNLWLTTKGYILIHKLWYCKQITVHSRIFIVFDLGNTSTTSFRIFCHPVCCPKKVICIKL